MEFEELASFLVHHLGVVEGRGIPLLQTNLRVRPFIAEEEDVFLCDERGEVLCMLKLAREVALVITHPARSFRHISYNRGLRYLRLGSLSDRRRDQYQSSITNLLPKPKVGLGDVRGTEVRSFCVFLPLYGDILTQYIHISSLSRTAN